MNLGENSVMTVTLNKKQHVFITSHVHFQHRADSGKDYEIVLNWRQFLNLHDYIRNYNTLFHISNFPLGDGIWLYHKETVTELIDHHKKRFFSFYEEAWINYRHDFHFLIYDSYKHGKPYDYQSDAKHDRQRRDRLRRYKSHISKHHKTLPRTTRDGSHEDDKWSKLTNVSQRKGSNSRSSFRRRGRKYASRIYRQIKADKYDYEDEASDGDDDLEHGDECAIEEESVSEQDPLE